MENIETPDVNNPSTDNTETQRFLWDPESYKLLCLLNDNQDKALFSRFGGAYEICVTEEVKDPTDPLGVVFLWDEIDIWNRPDILKKFSNSISIPAVVFLNIAIDITKTYDENINYEELQIHESTTNFLTRENVMIPWEVLLGTMSDKIKH